VAIDGSRFKAVNSGTALSRELGSRVRDFSGLGSGSGRGRRPPRLERLASENAERVAPPKPDICEHLPSASSTARRDDFCLRET
jgi:hypothetical protein